MFRIIKIFKPRYVIGENVRGIVNIENGMVFETVCSNLEDEGYEVQPFLIPAASVGAPHRRERIWFIASLVNTEHDGLSTSKIEGSSVASSDNNEKGQNETSEFKGTGGSRDSKDVADTNSGLRRGGRTIEPSRENEEGFLYSKEEEQTREHLRSETIGRSSVRGEATDVANANTRLGNGENEEIQARGKASNFSSTRTGTEDVADTESIRTGESREFNQEERSEGSSSTQLDGSSSNDANTSSGRRSLQEREIQTGRNSSQHQSWWLVEPNVGRVAHGISGRIHRLKALGNSIVPQIVEEIGRAIIEAERE
jgi:DNA (cytosine-5)-methyltransferase 1